MCGLACGKGGYCKPSMQKGGPWWAPCKGWMALAWNRFPLGLHIDIIDLCVFYTVFPTLPLSSLFELDFRKTSICFGFPHNGFGFTFTFSSSLTLAFKVKGKCYKLHLNPILPKSIICCLLSTRWNFGCQLLGWLRLPYPSTHTFLYNGKKKKKEKKIRDLTAIPRLHSE